MQSDKFELCYLLQNQVPIWLVTITTLFRFRNFYICAIIPIDIGGRNQIGIDFYGDFALQFRFQCVITLL